MRVLDPGHVYELALLDTDVLDLPTPDRLVFVKREGAGYPGNLGHHAGTNIQEVLRACIDRVTYLDNQIPNWRNDAVLDHLRASLYLLERRAAERHGRTLPQSLRHMAIEHVPTCAKCGHIGCDGQCHA